MRISVIIPLLDSPMVGATVRALAEQGIPGDDAELVVVGRDGCRCLPRAPSLRFVETVLPPAGARNLGVRNCRGERLLFVDADCVPRPGWAAGLDTALGGSPVAGGAVSFSYRSNPWALADNIASFHELLPDRPAQRASRRPLGSLNLAVRRDAWDRVGPFNESLTTSEDFDWVLRARAAGLDTAFVPDARVEHGAVRRGPADVRAHARWYGEHFHAVCRLHPGLFPRGPSWKTRRRLAAALPLKSLTSALGIYLRHPRLLPCLWALPGVVLFKHAWYRAVLDTWPEDGPGRS